MSFKAARPPARSGPGPPEGDYMNFISVFDTLEMQQVIINIENIVKLSCLDGDTYIVLTAGAPVCVKGDLTSELRKALTAKGGSLTRLEGEQK